MQFANSARRRQLLRATTLTLALNLNAAPRAMSSQTVRPGSDTTLPGYRRTSERVQGDLAEILASADSTNPAIIAARARVGAARASARAAGAWSDPVLMAGILNLPLGAMAANEGEHGARAALPGDDMTMKMIGVQQTVPYRGKLRLRRQILDEEANAAVARLEGVRRTIARDIRKAYFEIAYLDRAIALVERSSTLLGGIVRVTEASYSTGRIGQQDVLKARSEAARLGETASALLEERKAQLADLNALLDRASVAPVSPPDIPPHIEEAAVSRQASQIRFASTTLGSRAADSPIPALEYLQELAVRNNAGLRELTAKIAAQSARAALAQKSYKPDIDFTLQYGQRDRRPDMVTATVSFPLPIHKRARQDQEVLEAKAEFAALSADERSAAARIRADVARLVSDMERDRSQLALYRKAILPQGEAAMAVAAASYQSGKGDLRSVLENQAALFAYESANQRALADFAKSLAELEEIVGAEVLK